jgi:sugar/nucleoside kinase (ribokinase family)
VTSARTAPVGAARPVAGSSARPVDVVTLGAHVLDVHVWPVDEIGPGQSSSLVETIKLSVAGTAAGTAVDLARLGLNVASIGCVGDDLLGQMLLQVLEKEGVDCSAVVVRSADTTSASVLPIRRNGERPALHVRGANALLVAEDIDEALVVDAAFLHVGGPDETVGLDLAALGALVTRARQAGVVVTSDLIRGSRPEFLRQISVALRDASYFMPNHDQLLGLTGALGMGEAIRVLRAAGIGGTAVVKLGAMGSVIVPPTGDWTHLAAYELTPVDTTGCGDAYCAGFITGLHEGLPVEDAAVLGTRAAALVAGGLGSDAGVIDRASISDANFDDLAVRTVSADELDTMLGLMSP